MGMFDRIKFTGECSGCGAPIIDWQSKDADCLLEEIDPIEVNEFYGICPVCDTMTYYDVKKKIEIDEIVQRKDTNG